MQISTKLPDDTEAQRVAQELIAQNQSLQAVIDIAGLPFSKATLGDIARGRFDNVSRNVMQEFRRVMGMDPLPEAKLVIKRPSPKRKRKTTPRYHPPQDPEKAAEYLSARMSSDDMEDFISILRGINEDV